MEGDRDRELYVVLCRLSECVCLWFVPDDIFCTENHFGAHPPAPQPAQGTAPSPPRDPLPCHGACDPSPPASSSDKLTQAKAMFGGWLS